jgi:carboxynorspermidine decarboxylase
VDYKRTLEILSQAPTPCFTVDTALLERNLKILDGVQREAGCTILLALKAFAMWEVFPIIARTLKGTCASGPIEARLGREKFGGEVHTYAPAYTDSDYDEVIKYSDHVIFNSVSQARRHMPKPLPSGRTVDFGLRINPQVSTGHVAIYDPCSPNSRLGIPADSFPEVLPEGISGIHFHTLCQQNADALKITLDSIEKNFSGIIQSQQLKWINFGGGHHITREDYNIDLLISLIKRIKERYGLRVYVEPGEAVVLNAGYLTASAVDIIENGMKVAVLDMSASCHTPDVIEMPYRPEIIGAGHPSEKKFTYRLGGISCLAGDIIGDYSFDSELTPGSRITFTDMAHYSMVKTNTFNGVRLPSIAVMNSDIGEFRVIRKFGYDEYMSRLS